MSHLSFSSWLCPVNENKKKIMRGWNSFLSFLSLGKSDTYDPRIIFLCINYQNFVFLLLFNDDKIFLVFPRLKNSKRDFVYEAHTWSSLLKEAIESEANSRVCNSLRQDPITWDRAQAPASIISLSKVQHCFPDCPNTKEGLVKWHLTWEFDSWWSPGDSVVLQRPQTV